MADQNEARVGLLGTLLRSLKGVGTAADIKESVREALNEDDQQAESSISEAERELLGNILEYGEVRVEDILVPRSDIVGVDVSTDLKKVALRLAEAAHSRLPVYRDTLDEVLGMIHVKDILAYMASDKPEDKFSLNDLKRSVLYAPASMRIIDLLAQMRRQRSHMAIVVDEYGGTDGLVTIEDVVEQIVGEIEDEHDVDSDPQISEAGPGLYVADARVEIEVLEQQLGYALLKKEEEDEADTLGGLVFMLAGEVPEIGTLVDHESGIVFEVINADPRRIKKLRVHLPSRKMSAQGAKRVKSKITPTHDDKPVEQLSEHKSEHDD